MIVDVWCADLDGFGSKRGSALGALLSDDEHRRARRFRSRPAARRYTAGREMLRAILGRRNGLHPAEVVFQYGRHGKPSPCGATFFSVAHSDELCLIAATSHGEVGIDIERIRDGVDLVRLAPRIFEEEELRGLATLPPGARSGAFFERWVQTEARSKALGDGLLPWWASRASAALIPTDAAGCEDENTWILRTFSPGAGAIACLALRGHHQLSMRRRSIAELDMTRSA